MRVGRLSTASTARFANSGVIALTTTETSRASRIARAPRLPVTLTASSNSASEPKSMLAMLSATTRWLRLVCSNWRTMKVPVFAVDFQWMWRRSSPGMYSRRAWKARSLDVRSRVGWPSRSRTSPLEVEGMSIVRGCTMNSAAAVQSRSRRTRPMGSARTVRTGPSVRRPRRSVGMATLRRACPRAARPGTGTGTTEVPTGRSTTVPKERRALSLRTTMLACAGSPTATR